MKCGHVGVVCTRGQEARVKEIKLEGSREEENDERTLLFRELDVGKLISTRHGNNIFKAKNKLLL